MVEFSFGLVAFRAARRADARAVAGHPLTAPIVTAAILLLLAYPGSDLAIVALLPLLLISLAHGRGPVQAFLGWRPMFILGELSYAIYLLHPRLAKLWPPPAVLLARWIGMEAAWRVSFVVVLLACASLLHGLVEKPCRRAVRRLEGRLGRGERDAVLASEAAGRRTLT